MKPSQNNGIHKEMPGLEAYHTSSSLQMYGQKVLLKVQRHQEFHTRVSHILKVCCENAWQSPQTSAIYMELKT